MASRLRFITYMSPGIPEEIYRCIVEYLGESLSRPTSLEFETRFSGPPRGTSDPFSASEADLGWMCTPSYFWLQEPGNVPVRLVPAGMVFDDPRNGGRPHYFSDVVVRQDSDAEGFLDLRGRSWVYNDTSSQSGYYNLLEKLAEIGETLSFFGSVSASGSHQESLHRVMSGTTDAAAIDANVLAHQLRLRPELRGALKIVATWGPHAIQPFVASRRLAEPVVQEIAEVLVNPSESFRARLQRCGVTGFERIDESHYEAERAALSMGEALLSR